MIMNIGCAIPGCDRRVIGNCPGYKKPCGRYYCEEHHTGNLCSYCAKEQKEEELQQSRALEYTKVSEEFYRQHIPESDFENPEFIFDHPELIRAGFLSLIIGITTCVIGFLILNNYPMNQIGSGLAFIGLVINIFPIIVIVNFLNERYEWHNREKEKVVSNRLRQLEYSKPGFIQFYENWLEKQKAKEKKEREENTKKALAVVGIIFAIALAGLAAGAGSNNDRDRDRR